MSDETTLTGGSFTRGGALTKHPVKALILAHVADPARFGEIGVLGRVVAVIGRDPAVGLFPCGPLVDGLLSRRHAEVAPAPGGGHRIRDLGSRNGTFVNRVAVPREEGRLLQPGDVVRTGGVISVYREVPGDLIDLAKDLDSSMAGVSIALRRIQQQIRLLARVHLPVLLQGESGTGKELAARDLHRLGDRRDGPFVPVNCAAIPKDLAEATLFGHERGAFTGATERRAGLFEEADGGTLFLDELGELSLAVQAKLLRVLEDGSVMRLGGTRPSTVSVRVIAATRDPLPAAIRAGTFRDDLYARIAQVVVDLPPLRDRIEDLPVLMRGFLALGPAANRHIPEELVEELMLHPWRLNIRELRSLVEILPLDNPEADLPLRLGDMARARMDSYRALGSDGEDDNKPMDGPRLDALLARHGGNVSKVAAALGVHRYQVYRWMERFGLRKQ